MISSISTVLFESINIVNDIFVWENTLSKFILPNSPFTRIRNSTDVKNALMETKNVDLNILDFWSDDSLKNYKDFITNIIPSLEK